MSELVPCPPVTVVDRPRSSRLSVLVVDDDPDVRDLLETTLKVHGYEVRCVADGVSGLADYRARRPDLVLLDVVMPGLSGLQVLRRIRASEVHEQVPVVLLTARALPSEVAAGLEAGADAYITKPFGLQTLVDELARLLAATSRRTTQPSR